MARTQCEQTDGRTDRVIPIYPQTLLAGGISYIPPQTLFAGGIIM